MRGKFSFFFFCFFFYLTTTFADAPATLDCLERINTIAYLETAQNLLSKAEYSYPGCENDLETADILECRKDQPLACIIMSQKVINDVISKFPTCSKPVSKDENFRDCSEILASGRNESGIYTIFPTENSIDGKPLKVYCDMETDGGGWMVVQRRGKSSVQRDFFRDWESYKNGFGNLKQEFWLGNENIRVLCEKGCKIRFDLQAENGDRSMAVYQKFYLTSNYVININDYSGNAGDAMRYSNNLAFSTKDKGNTKRAQELQGGWWYNDEAVYSHLNGQYKPGTHEIQTVNWYPWRQHENLASVEIKVKPT